MPVSITTFCGGCGGLGQVWLGVRIVDCAECAGTGTVRIQVRTVYDMLADHAVARGVDSSPDAHPHPDPAAAADIHVCLWCDTNAHEDTIHVPCAEHAAGAASDARNGLDHHRGASPRSTGPAAAYGQGLPGRDVGCHERDEWMRTPAGGCLHRPPGEGSMNAGLERWR